MAATGFDYWIAQANAQGQTDAERLALRNQVRARYGMGPEQKKKNWWDKAKNWVIPVVSAVAGLLTGGAAAPLVSTLTGATIRGIDEKSFKGALRGAGEGYLGGLGGTALKGAYLGAKAGTGVAGTLAGAGRGAVQAGRAYLPGGGGASKVGKVAAEAGDQGVYDRILANAADKGSRVSGLLSGTTTVGGAMQSALAGMKPETMQGILQGGGMALGGYLQADASRQQMEFQREQQRLEQERANRLASLLAPMAAAQGQLIGSQYGAYGQIGR